jgi:GTP-binding protein
MFADTSHIEIRAGKGGNGRSSFRHEKYRENGGPDGGNGGRGGDVIVRVSHNVNTLAYYRTARLITADDGLVGGENEKQGKSGADMYVDVPLGTQLWDEETLVADLVDDGTEIVIARGGRGGFGNSHFQSSTRQAPKVAELGEPGVSMKLRMELKLVADVGLVGLPNAGKSTLLSVITNAKPEIADYPFTTLIPNLGVVDQDKYTFLVADIPGLIEGASEGKGLGDEFLRHVERTAVIFHLVDAGNEDPAGSYKTIQKELADYVIDLTDRPQIVVLTKTETIDEKTLENAMKKLKKVIGDKELFTISAQAHRGLTELLRAAVVLVREAREQREIARSIAEVVVIDSSTMPELWRVVQDADGVFRVEGERIEGFAMRTDFENEEGAERLRDIFRKQGIARELKKMGIAPGEQVRVGATEFTWL